VEEVPPMEVVPAVEERPVMGVAMHAVATEAMISAAAIDVRRAQAAAAKTSAMKAAAAAETTSTTTPWPPRTSMVRPSLAYFADGNAAGLDSDSASARP